MRLAQQASNGRLRAIRLSGTLTLALCFGACTEAAVHNRTLDDAGTLVAAPDHGDANAADAATPTGGGDAEQSSVVMGGRSAAAASGGNSGAAGVVLAGGTGASRAGAGGAAASGGAAPAGAGAGTGGIAGGTGGVGGAAGSGTAGRSGAGGGTAGMGSAGKAGGSGTGGGGAAGGISVAAIGQSCDVSDAAACQAHASRDRVRCDGSQWIEDTPCSVDERCSTSQGAVCKAWIRDCTTADQKICVGAAIHSCGVDLLSSTPVSTCTGMTPYCEAGSCVAAACPTASSENLLRNPGFDTNVDFWIPADGQPLPIWSRSDSTQCAHSGSMKLSGPTSRVHQCASSPGADLIIGGEMIGNSRSSGAPEIELTFWSGTACDGDQLDDVTISFSSVQIGGAWRPVSSTYTPFQKGAASVDFAIFAGPDVNCDNLFLTKNPGHF